MNVQVIQREENRFDIKVTAYSLIRCNLQFPGHWNDTLPHQALTVVTDKIAKDVVKHQYKQPRFGKLVPKRLCHFGRKPADQEDTHIWEFHYKVERRLF